MLGKLIKTYIKFKGLKQNVIAKKSDLSVQTLNDILNERRKIEATEYFAICKALEVSTEYFEQLITEAEDNKGDKETEIEQCANSLS